SYLLLTGYDFLALSYADHKLRSRETLFASFISFTFSNNLGFALMSGSSVRYWIYTGFGLHPVEIGEVVAFCTLTYALGVTTVGGLMILLGSAGMSSILKLPQPLLLAAGIRCLRGASLTSSFSSPGAGQSLSGIINCGCPRSGAGLCNLP
ncbi:MAG: lysylphosphatidylglycerol synthase transmembrane domain-containing protein, partial [Terriglobales bacterium]